jgi:hypothetical protein
MDHISPMHHCVRFLNGVKYKDRYNTVNGKDVFTLYIYFT